MLRVATPMFSALSVQRVRFGETEIRTKSFRIFSDDKAVEQKLNDTILHTSKGSVGSGIIEVNNDPNYGKKFFSIGLNKPVTFAEMENLAGVKPSQAFVNGQWIDV